MRRSIPITDGVKLPVINPLDGVRIESHLAPRHDLLLLCHLYHPLMEVLNPFRSPGLVRGTGCGRCGVGSETRKPRRGYDARTWRWKSSPFLMSCFRLAFTIQAASRNTAYPNHLVRTAARSAPGSCDSLLRYHNLGRSEENWGIKKKAKSAALHCSRYGHTTLEAYTAYLAGHAKVSRCR
jgi:hypothetical protein